MASAHIFKFIWRLHEVDSSLEGVAKERFSVDEKRKQYEI
jgi:hypothetical protein